MGTGSFCVTDCTDVDILVKNVEAMRHKLVKEFIREKLVRSGKCAHCAVRVHPVRQDNHAKVVLLGKIYAEVYDTPRCVLVHSMHCLGIFLHIKPHYSIEPHYSTV